MSSITLGELCGISTGQSAPQDDTAFTSKGIPFVRAGSLAHLVSGGPEDELEKISIENAHKYRMKLFPKNTVVFAKSGMSAKIARVYKLHNDCYLVSHLAAIKPCAEINSGYLLRWFQKNPPSRLIANDAYPSIRTSDIQKITLNLPPLEEQKRIAAILDKADAIRRKRQQAIELADQFLRSVFLDMFGDPVTNPKGWEPVLLGDLLDSIDGGYSPKCEKRPAGTDEIGVLKLSAISRGEFIPSENKAFTSNTSKEKFLFVNEGDLLFSRKNTFELIGASILVNGSFRNLALPDLIFRLNIKREKDVLPEYLQAFMMLPEVREWIRGLASGSAGSMPNIAKSRLVGLNVLLPPIELQEKYRKIVRNCYEIKNKLVDSEGLLLKISGSLSQQAFKGELTQSKAA